MVRWREASFAVADVGVGGMLEAWTDISSGWIWAGVFAVGVAGMLYSALHLRKITLLASKSDDIPLADAMVRAWNIEGIRDLPEFQTLARERPQDIYRRLAERIFDGGDPNLSIRGSRSRFHPQEEVISEPYMYTVSDDLTAMTSIGDATACYRDLRVRWSDVEASIRVRLRTEGHLDVRKFWDRGKHDKAP